MKYKIKYLVTLSVCSLLAFSSCSDSWLETDPTETTEGKDIFASTSNAKLAINGICRTMVQQHSYYGQAFNGEGTMKLLYAEYSGQDFNFPYMAPGWYSIMNNASTQTQNSSSIYDAYPWYYYYLIVGNANAVIKRIGDAKGPQTERDFLKAEALTFRAYAFFRLTQIYCDSWASSNNGASKGIVLRLDEINEAEQPTDMPLSTLAQTYERVYKDLDDALTLYKSSGLTRAKMYADAKSQIPFPDAAVAHAIYARAALTKQDYGKALSEAQSASKGHDLMDTNTYRSGFCTPNNEWIWGVYNDASETIWYYGWQLYMACNGYYATQGINTCINRTLVESFSDSDIRKGLFLTESTFLPEDGSAKFLDLIGTSSKTAGQFKTKNPDGSPYAPGIAAAAKANAYASKIVPTAASQTYAYANLKFQATGQPAVGCQPIFRSSEMLLIQAEANYYLKAEKDAQNNLIALNKTSGRDANYTCTKTGEDLLKEIKKYRRLELWGEGFSWFDCKRWGDAVIRPTFKSNGNYSSYIAGTYGVDTEGSSIATYWKWILPNREADYNTAISLK